jgi:hypothetical protein
MYFFLSSIVVLLRLQSNLLGGFRLILRGFCAAFALLVREIWPAAASSSSASHLVYAQQLLLPHQRRIFSKSFSAFAMFLL